MQGIFYFQELKWWSRHGDSRVHDIYMAKTHIIEDSLAYPTHALLMRNAKIGFECEPCRNGCHAEIHTTPAIHFTRAVWAITKIGNRGIGESGNRGIREYGNGKRYRYAVCGIITNYQIQVYSQKIKGIPHGI